MNVSRCHDAFLKQSIHRITQRHEFTEGFVTSHIGHDLLPPHKGHVWDDASDNLWWHSSNGVWMIFFTDESISPHPLEERKQSIRNVLENLIVKLSKKRMSIHLANAISPSSIPCFTMIASISHCKL